MLQSTQLSKPADGEEVADSPYPLRVLPDTPSPRNSYVVPNPALATNSKPTTGTTVAAINTQSSFEIVACDQFGNQYFGDNLDSLLPLNIELESNGIMCPVVVQVQRDGKFLCEYTPKQVGFYRLHVCCGKSGKALPRTPCSIVVVDDAIESDIDDTINKIEMDSKREESTSNTAAAGTPAGAVKQLNSNNVQVKDEVSVWERIAAAAYAADGVLDGWDSEEEERKKNVSPEEEYIKVRRKETLCCFLYSAARHSTMQLYTYT